MISLTLCIKHHSGPSFTVDIMKIFIYCCNSVSGHYNTKAWSSNTNSCAPVTPQTQNSLYQQTVVHHQNQMCLRHCSHTEIKLQPAYTYICDDIRLHNAHTHEWMKFCSQIHSTSLTWWKPFTLSSSHSPHSLQHVLLSSIMPSELCTSVGIASLSRLFTTTSELSHKSTLNYVLCHLQYKQPSVRQNHPEHGIFPTKNELNQHSTSVNQSPVSRCHQ